MCAPRRRAVAARCRHRCIYEIKILCCAHVRNLFDFSPNMQQYNVCDALNIPADCAVY